MAKGAQNQSAGAHRPEQLSHGTCCSLRCGVLPAWTPSDAISCSSIWWICFAHLGDGYAATIRSMAQECCAGARRVLFRGDPEVKGWEYCGACGATAREQARNFEPQRTQSALSYKYLLCDLGALCGPFVVRVALGFCPVVGRGWHVVRQLKHFELVGHKGAQIVAEVAVGLEKKRVALSE